MTALSYRRTADDREPVLLIDAQPVDRDALVTLPAWSIAELAYQAHVHSCPPKGDPPRRRIGFEPPSVKVP